MNTNTPTTPEEQDEVESPGYVLPDYVLPEYWNGDWLDKYPQREQLTDDQKQNYRDMAGLLYDICKEAEDRFEAALGPDDDHTYMERSDRATDPVRTRNQLRREVRERWYGTEKKK